MVRNGFLVADSDLHVMEPPDMYERYLEPRYREAAPVWMARPESGHKDFVVKTDPGVSDEWTKKEMVSRKRLDDRKAEVYAEELRHGYTAEMTLRAMDVEGIDIAILFRTFAQMAIQVDGQDPDYTFAVCRAFNNWLHEFASVDGARLKGSGILALTDIPAAVDEARRCIEELGMAAVTLLPTVVDNRMVHDMECNPLWDAMQEMDIPVTFHDTSQGFAAKNPGNWFRDHPNNLVLVHAFSFPIPLMLSIGCVTAGGLLHRFPRLRMAFLEGNCSWAPWVLYRLDDQWETYGDSQEIQLDLKPSEYFVRQCYVSTETDGELLHHLVDSIGDDNVVLSTDYPHTDSSYPHAVESFLNYDKVSEKTKRKVLWDNCAKLYNLAPRQGVG